MKTYINEINELKSSNELINNKLEENNKEIISLKKELGEKIILFLLMKISMMKT